MMLSSQWSELYARMLGMGAMAQLLDRLPEGGRNIVIVTGCQRSGTSWMRKVLSQALPGAAAPKEYEVARFLVDGVDLPVSSATTLILQTTFANVYPSCYAALPDLVPVVLMIRNPYSVCRSLVYNWDSLSVEWAHRQRHPAEDMTLTCDRSRWEAAIAIYLQSARTGLQIISDRPERTRLVVYDEFVQHFEAGLARLAQFLERPLQADDVNERADPSTISKQALLPSDFRQFVAEQCVGVFEELLLRARELGSRLELPPSVR